MKKRVVKKIARGIGWLAVSPVILFLVLAVLLYIPPVQKFVVDRLARALSESMDMRISVGHVRLAFPLDLVAGDVVAADRTDTLASVRALRLDVALWPLLEGRADIDDFAIYDTRLNTKQLIPDTYVRGTVGRLEASVHGVDWKHEKVVLDRATLGHAHLMIALSDTAAADTTPPSKWVVRARQIRVDDSDIQLSMPGDSMRLRLALGKAVLTEGHFDTGRGYYALQRLTLDRGALRYATRAPQHGRPAGNAAFATWPPLQWDSLPTVGRPLNPALVDLTDVALRLDSLSYSPAGTLRLNLHHLRLREQCGLAVHDMHAYIYMDSTRVRLRDAHLNTRHSQIDAEVDLPFAAMQEHKMGQANADIHAKIGMKDIRLLARGFVDPTLLHPLSGARLAGSDLLVDASLTGGADAVTLHELTARWEGILDLHVRGKMTHPLRDGRSGRLDYDLKMDGYDALRAFLPRDVRTSVNVPRATRMKGWARVQGNDLSLRSDVTTPGGSMQLTAAVNPTAERYRADVQAHRFPLGKFLPGMGLGAMTARIRASGHGFDPMRPSARLQADAEIGILTYNEWQLGRMELAADLSGGKAQAVFKTDNDIVKATGQLNATMGNVIRATLDGKFNEINLQRLAGLKDTLAMGTQVHLEAFADRRLTDYGVKGGLERNFFLTKSQGIPAKDIRFDFATNRDTTTLQASAGDLDIDLGAKGDLDRLTGALAVIGNELAAQMSRKQLDHERLKAVLPDLTLKMDVGQGNPVSNLMRYMGYTFNTLRADVRTTPATGINGTMQVGALRNGGLLIDTINLAVFQDSLGIRLDGRVKNYTKRNPTKFEALLTGQLTREEAGIGFKFIDSEGETGIDLGMKAQINDRGLQLQLSPLHPIIAYRNFTVGGENYIFLGRDRSISADIDLVADDGTALSLYSQPDSTANDLTLSLHRVNLGELSDVLPYLPPMAGFLDGDVHIIDDHTTLSAMASVNAKSLSYDGAELGNIGLEAIYLPKEGGEHHFNAFVSSDETEVMALEGIYYDRDEGYFDGKAELLDFPLKMLNGFLSGTDMAMSGNALGTLTIKGATSAPVLSGQLQFDSAHFYSDVYGIDFTLDPDPVEIHEGKMKLNDFRMMSRQSTNPLIVNGTLDMADLSNIRMNLNMDAHDFELVNTKRKMQSLVYGKVYADFRGSVRGTLDKMIVRGNLEVLSRTDMTYILKDSPLTVDDRLHDLVQFVDFSDTATVAEEEVALPSTIDMTLGISVSDAAHFHCNLSEDGSNYVDIEGGGDLTMRMTEQGDLRLTGRFTMGQGEMKYSLPIIPLKTFKLAQGSYIEFTGDMMNPTLNIAAAERVKATVTENDQPRSVAFDVGVDITGGLETMGLEFTIEAPEDLTMQNKLASMTQAQRGKTAVAMLVTGMYLDDENLTSGGSGFKASNALTSFLQSEIQNIAGNALKSIDLSIGMENGTSETGSTTTDYSFQFAKRFWGNRISVIIGGKVSTGADATNSAESFIDNVAVEYRLDKSATRYVHAFYDRGTQDPFEGQLMKTGAGLVLRRKTDKLGELFIFRNRKKDKLPTK